MFIENHSYNASDLYQVQRLRYTLIKDFYSNPYYIQKLSETITKYIDYLSMEFSPTTYTFTIKIKKTSMRRLLNPKYQMRFRHTPEFYYQFILDIFTEFLQENYQAITMALQKEYGESEGLSTFHKVYMKPLIITNLCQVSCLADNIIIIKL